MLKIKFILCGAMQYGLMYITYIAAYQFLHAYEVALFTIFTPIYVTLIDNGFQRKFSKSNLITAMLAVIGTGIVVYKNLSDNDLIAGFFLIQISNLCFAFGQIYYRELMRLLQNPHDYQVFGLLYLGAVLIASVAMLFTTDWHTLTLSPKQCWTIAYLGIVASGICFFLWNAGARKVNSGVLAVFNNLKIPLAITVSIIVFREDANVLRLSIGACIVIIALFISDLKK